MNIKRLTRAGLLSDYPWAELGNSTVVDVGCGPGDSGIDVLHEYPQLNWIFQDFGHVIEQVKKVYSNNPVSTDTEQSRLSLVIFKGKSIMAASPLSSRTISSPMSARATYGI